jgi:hypothetical protein
MSTNATIVFVPGAWHTSAGFSAVMDLLATYNYPSIGLHLPSVSGTPVVKDMEPDKALIRSTVTKLVEDGKDVVVVSHSYGGAPANSSLEGLSKTEREKAGKKGGVVASAMISAFLLDVGESLLNGAKPAPWTTTEVSLTYVACCPDAPLLNIIHRVKHSSHPTQSMSSTTTSPLRKLNTGPPSCYRIPGHHSTRQLHMQGGRSSQCIFCCVSGTMRSRSRNSGRCARMRGTREPTW